MSDIKNKNKFENEILRRLKKAVNSKKAQLVVTSADESKGAWGAIKIEGFARLEVYGEEYGFHFDFYSPESERILKECKVEFKLKDEKVGK